jgi:alpha-glucoside transport system substrate-binding protein
MLALAAATALVTTGCLQEDGGGGGGGGGGGAGGGGKKGDGQVEIVFGFGGEQSKGFQESLQQFQTDSGIKIKFTEASQSFDTLIRTRVQANNAPDIALFPQPGILKDFARQNKMSPLEDQVDLGDLENRLVPGILSAGTEGGKAYGVPVTMNVKSLVFYPKKAFEEKNYQVPKTLDELSALADQIKSDGTPPWCMGIESGPATGWPATDWMEDLVLRTGGPETYDKWVNHEIPFDDPAVKQAAETFEKLVLAEGNAFGGRKGIVSTAFSTAANPMFQNPPKCFLHRQGNFITQKGFFPDKIVANIDEEVGVFYFPGTAEDNAPVLGGGDLAAVFAGKDDDTKKVLEFITSEEYPGFSEEAGFMSPLKDYPLDKYKKEITRQMSKIAYEASVFRFDGSDQMPGAVGSGSFWKGMVAWISGQKELDPTLKDIEGSWPS